MQVRDDGYGATMQSRDEYERFQPNEPPTHQAYVGELRVMPDGPPPWIYVDGPLRSQILRSRGQMLGSGDWLSW